MPSDAVHPSSRSARIEVPDQLQQSRSSRMPQTGGSASPAQGPGRAAGEAAPPRREGVLGQLETERAHD